MPEIASIDRFTVPLGGQEIELQNLMHEAGGMALLRVRVRERTRFTIFDIDPATARRWGEAMVRWADAQGGSEAPGASG
jgi:hypothetical protein